MSRQTTRFGECQADGKVRGRRGTTLPSVWLKLPVNRMNETAELCLLCLGLALRGSEKLVAPSCLLPTI